MTIGARLVELSDRRVYAIGGDPVIVGRDPQCDVLVSGTDVSRRHAYVLRTPQGIVVVDTSAHGTLVNGERVQSQRLLAGGDVIQIGGHSFLFDNAGSAGRPRYTGDLRLPTTSDHPSQAPGRRRTRKLDVGRTLAGLAARPSWSSRAREWIRRYALGEIVGLGAALAAAWLVHRATHSDVATAFGASLAESLGYYGAMVVQEMVQEAYAAGTKRTPYGLRQIAATWRALLLEFGPAELGDTLFLRPFTMWLGQETLGLAPGIVAGKVVADLAFYAPVILTYEIRKARDSRRP
jgi:hypothetical protein